MPKATITVLTLLISACALFPASEADCRPASWRQRGYDDGYLGGLAQDMRLAKECAGFGIVVASEEYLAGYRDGYKEWELSRKRR